MIEHEEDEETSADESLTESQVSGPPVWGQETAQELDYTPDSEGVTGDQGVWTPEALEASGVTDDEGDRPA